MYICIQFHKGRSFQTQIFNEFHIKWWTKQLAMLYQQLLQNILNTIQCSFISVFMFCISLYMRISDYMVLQIVMQLAPPHEPYSRKCAIPFHDILQQNEIKLKFRTLTYQFLSSFGRLQLVLISKTQISFTHVLAFATIIYEYVDQCTNIYIFSYFYFLNDGFMYSLTLWWSFNYYRFVCRKWKTKKNSNR